MIFRFLAIATLLLFGTTPALSTTTDPDQSTEEAVNPHRADAESFEALVNRIYAYPERFGGERFELTDELQRKARAVNDEGALLAFVERALFLLADHHAITGASFADSWAVVPSYSDMWIELVDGTYRITSVRKNSPAAQAGIVADDRLAAVDGVPINAAVSQFWDDLGAQANAERRAFAARVLTAGRRNRSRNLDVVSPAGRRRTVELPSFYNETRPTTPITRSIEDGKLVIGVNDSLGENATIAAFDDAMEAAIPGQPIIIDLRNTPSGGNTTIARAIMGWFVLRPRMYQMHSLPLEERETGIARQWIEQVLPREGKYHAGPVELRVGRWTGSMGEGLAVGFDALGACVTGSRMAGLRGAIYDHRLENSGLVVKLPTERLMHIDGTPREGFVPAAAREGCKAHAAQ